MTVAVYMQVDRFFPNEIAQRTAIQKWLIEKNLASWHVQWYIDREDKNEFKQLSKDMDSGTVKMFVIYSLEQVFPSIASITKTMDNFASKNVAFASVSQGIYFNHDSIKSAHSLLVEILNLAEHHKRTRQRIGIEKAQEKGLYKGKKAGSTKPNFNPRRILTWRKRGWNAKQIGAKLGIAESTVFKYLRILKKDIVKNYQS